LTPDAKPSKTLGLLIRPSCSFCVHDTIKWIKCFRRSV